MASPDGTLLGAPLVTDILAACETWPRGVVSSDFARPFSSAIPTLLMSGGRDPVTPPDLADSAAATLTKSERYIDPTKGHATLDDQGRAVLADFIQGIKRD